MFDNFWNLYPKKVAKGAAIKAWKKLTSLAEREDAIDALHNHIKYYFQDYIPLLINYI